LSPISICFCAAHFVKFLPYLLQNETTGSHSAENMNNNPDAQTDGVEISYSVDFEFFSACPHRASFLICTLADSAPHSSSPSTSNEPSTNSLASPTSGLHGPDKFPESWLAVWLLKKGVHPQLVRDC